MAVDAIKDNVAGEGNAVSDPVPVVHLKDIHKSFGDLEVIRGVELKAHTGEVLSLIGSSGSGKSTLLRCANLLEIPQAGDVIFDGKPVHWKLKNGNRAPAYPDEVRLVRTNLSMVFQQFNLWSHLTVLENVTEAPITVLGRDKVEAEESGRRYLDKVGIG